MGNHFRKGSSSAPGASEALILVVGNDSSFKSRVAEDLAEASDATELVNKAGIRLFLRKSAQEPVVIDTAPFKTVKDWSRDDTARIWLTQNSLRQRSGQFVFVVCTITSTDVDDEIFLEPDFEHNEFSWLHVLARVFEHSRNKIMFLVNSDGSTGDATKRRVREVLKRDGFRRPENIIFASPSTRGGYLNTPIIRTVLQSSVNVGKAGDETTTENDEETTENDDTAVDNWSASILPFQLPEISEHGIGKFGPWGPETIILFGISGSGKSTFAKMMTTGRLDGVDCLSNKFSTSSGLRGETKEVKVGQGRGWRVVDTPGLGESNDDKGTGISTDRAAKLIREYVMLVQGVYCHFIFVLKKDRLTPVETRLWNIFNQVFHAEGIDNHMTIVVSGADELWLDENKSYLQETFDGCTSFLAADFPSIDPELVGDKEAEQEFEDTGRESLKRLEENLAVLCRLDLSCNLGKWSVGTQRSLLARGGDELINSGTHMRQNQAFGPSAGLPPQPSDYETVRSYVRLKSLTTRTFMPGGKLDLAEGL